MREPLERALPIDPGSDAEARISVLRIVGILLHERRLIVMCVGVGLATSLVAALMRDTNYTTRFSFVPQSAPDPGRAGLASLAGQFGVSLAGGGAAQSSQLYADLLQTREVLAPIAMDSFIVSGGGARRVPLPAILKISGGDPAIVLDKTLTHLRKSVISTSVATRTTGVVNVSVRTTSPEVSLQIAQRLLQGLNDFNLGTRQNQAREERRFTEERLDSARAALRRAEDALLAFLQSNRQFGNSPQLAFERDRLQREVAFQQQLVTGLAQQYEEARIREVRNTPVITMIEKPIRAPMPDPRGRAMVLLGGLLTSIFIGILAALVRFRVRDLRSSSDDPALEYFIAEWRQVRGARG